MAHVGVPDDCFVQCPGESLALVHLLHGPCTVILHRARDVRPTTCRALRSRGAGRVVEMTTHGGRRLLALPDTLVETSEGALPAGDIPEGASLLPSGEAVRRVVDLYVRANFLRLTGGQGFCLVDGVLMDLHANQGSTHENRAGSRRDDHRSHQSSCSIAGGACRGL